MNKDIELAARIEAELRMTVPGILEALKVFRDNPTAQTFKDAENIPDALVGQALDRIIGEVLKDAAARNAPESANSDLQKKAAMDGGRSESSSSTGN